MTEKTLPVKEGLIIEYPKYNCEIHGEHSNYIESTIPGFQDRWCHKCWFESLDKMGVKRMTKIE